MDEHVCDTENEGIDLHHEMLLFSEDHRWYVSLRSDDVEAVAQISAPRCRFEVGGGLVIGPFDTLEAEQRRLAAYCAYHDEMAEQDALH